MGGLARRNAVHDRGGVLTLIVLLIVLALSLCLLGFFWWPCCCPLLSDDFNRADSTNLGADWTEISGAWEIASNQLKIPGGGSAFVQSVKEHATAYVNISVQVKADTAGDQARIILDYTDASNFHFAQVQFGAGGHLRIYSRSGGADTQLNSVAIAPAINTLTTFTVCTSDSGRLLAVCGNLISAPVTLTGAGKFGLGTGTCAGNIFFENFAASKTDDCCPKCSVQCSTTICIGGSSPGEIKLVISGMTGAPAGCLPGNCSSAYDGTYYIPFRSFNGCGAGSGCCYRHTPGPCGQSSLDVNIETTQIRITTVPINYGTWRVLHTTPIDCLTLSNFSVPWFGGTCDGSSSTAYVSAV